MRPLLLTRSASGVFWICFFFLGTARVLRAAATGAPSTPGRLGYGDESGREIQEKQKPAFQIFGQRGQRSLSSSVIISDKSLEICKTVFSQPLVKTPVIIYTD